PAQRPGRGRQQDEAALVERGRHDGEDRQDQKGGDQSGAAVEQPAIEPAADLRHHAASARRPGDIARPAMASTASVAASRITEAAPASGQTSCSSTKPSISMARVRSEEHTSELQSHLNLVCRLLLEKKK